MNSTVNQDNIGWQEVGSTNTTKPKEIRAFPDQEPLNSAKRTKEIAKATRKEASAETIFPPRIQERIPGNQESFPLSREQLTALYKKIEDEASEETCLDEIGRVVKKRFLDEKKSKGIG